MNGLLATLNPVWWLQVRLLGGPTRLISICAVYLSLLVAGIIGFRYLDRKSPIASYCDGVIFVLSIIQGLLMVLGGCNAVFKALTRDVNTKMLESHRLTPLSAAAVTSGYIIGANAQVLATSMIGVVVGAVVIRWGTVGLSSWLVGNLELFLIAPMAWTATLALGMGRDKPVNPAAILFVLVILGAPLLFLPGAGLLSGVYGGYIAIRTMSGINDVPASLAAVPLSVGMIMSVIWARGAMRKFRRPDLPAFGPVRALGLLIIWLSTGALGLLLSEEAVRKNVGGLGRQSSGMSDPYFIPICLTVTAAMAMLIAILPMHASTFARIRRLRGAVPHRPGEKSATIGMPLLCTTLILAFVPLHHLESWKLLVLASVGLWASLLVIEGLLLMTHARGRNFAGLIGVYVVLFWGGPPLLDVWAGELLGASSATHMAFPLRTVVFGFSPLGSLAPLFIEDIRFNLMPGVGFQLFLGIVAWVLGRRALKRLRKRDAAMAS